MTKTRTIPWPRILVEGTAIVASILLAFAIDAWWDEQKERADEREVLLALKAEFEVNKREAKAVIDHHEDSVQRIREFKSMRPDLIEAMAPVDSRILVASFASPRTFDPQRGSVRALIGAGKLGILRDHALRDALMSFMTIVEDADEDRYYMGETSLWVWRELLRLGGPWRMLPTSYELGDCKDTNSNRYCYIVEHTRDLPDITTAELLLIQNDKVLMGLIDRNKIHSVRYASEVNEMLEQIERTLERIESGLDQV
jgi:hypothetical protein